MPESPQTIVELLFEELYPFSPTKNKDQRLRIAWDLAKRKGYELSDDELRAVVYHVVERCKD